MIKKTWIIPHEAVETFGWMFLNSFDASRTVPSCTASKHWKKKIYLIQGM